MIDFFRDNRWTLTWSNEAKHIIRQFLCFVLLVYSSIASPGESVFNCKVIEVYETTNEGLIKKSKSPIDGLKRGTTFVIDRNTGAVVGEAISSRYADEEQIVNWGTKDPRGDDNVYEVIWIVKGIGTTHLNTLVIHDWEKKKVKRMTGRVSGALISGLCE